MERLSKSEIIFKVLAYTLVGIFALLALYPIVYAFSVSISGRAVYEAGQIVLWPEDITLAAYQNILFDKDFWISYTNTLFYTTFGTIWSLLISLTGAYALAKNNLIGKRKWRIRTIIKLSECQFA